MGLLNYLFGSKKNAPKELVIDNDKRIKLWAEHLANYLLREKLAKHFNFGNIDNAVQNFKETDKILKQIEVLISPELVDISDEEKNEEELLSTLKSDSEIKKLSDNVLSAEQKQTALLKLFSEIFNVLQAELHLINLIKTKHSNLKELLLRLFEIISVQESKLYKVFREQYFFEENKSIHANIMKTARAIILEEELKEELETDEEKFAKEMLKKMASDESKSRYRKLGEAIFFELAEMAGAPMQMKKDITAGIKIMEGLINQDDIMYKIVKKLRPKYAEIKIKGVVSAFRKAYNLGHFEELESEFAT